MKPKRIAVAVPAPLFTTFDYEVEQGLTIAAGMRVRVPFGRRALIGVVTGTASDLATAGPARSYKPITELLDSEPLIPPEVLGLCQWAASYYQHPIGEVVATALPAQLKQGKAAELDQPQVLRLTAGGREALAGLPSRARAQRAVLQALAELPRAVEQLDEISPAVLRKALKNGWVERIPAAPEIAGTAGETPPDLTPEQAAALDILRAGPGRGREAAVPEFSVTLLEGVTGSGKTELYLRRAAEVIAQGRQVLMLAPEIGLTPQLAERFTRRFGTRVARYHSALPDSERTRSWLRARNGLAPVVVGTRSAAFLPFDNLGLIVVDEEHDGSFKQQEGLRYSARDLAIVRAKRAGIPVILGSATPALETLHNVRSGRYRHARLTRRIHSVAPPAIRLLDLRGQRLDHGLAPAMSEAIGRHLAADGQALLFINRRGYAPVLLCHDCGWQAPCKHCDARLTLHRARGRLICHHCGAQAAIPQQCGACNSRKLVAVGQGTERVEEALRAAFPERRIERFDSDRMRKRGELERLLADIGSGAIHILVGTQMLAKGHDFARLSLVGILDVDQALYGADFRALERMGQLITQVAGRAGRAGLPGEVILQTHEPHHLALRTLLGGGHAAFCDWLLAQRRQTGLPPFSFLALLRAESPQPAHALGFLEEARQLLAPDKKLSVLGPVPAPMEKLAGRHRAQVLLQSGSRAALQNALSAWVPKVDRLASARKVRWSVDVDPVDLF
jgi:primosomal protein N' (replication factor Y)